MQEQNCLIKALKTRGIRITPQRAIILEALEGLSGHVTAEEIFASVQKVNTFISLATIYRTLDLLKELGLIIESHMGMATAYYALRAHGTHHHAVCRGCRQSIELPDCLFTSIAEKLQVDHNFVADVDHMVIFGWCMACAEEAD